MRNGRAKALISNTVIFAVGNALTKLIQLVLMPLYTTFMTVGDYGVAELVNNMSDLLYPLLCLCVFESVFRFAMERDVDKGSLLVGAIGVLVAMTPIGFLVAFVAYAVFAYEQAWACLLLVVAVSARTILAQFARGVGEVRRFAVSGVLNTLALLAFTIVFIVFFGWGVPGYIAALILGNIGSSLYIAVSCRLWRFVGSRPDKSLLLRMLTYSLPLLPNTLAWWFMNIFGRYAILIFQGPVSAGLYTAASKLPSLVNFLSTIFQQAWQISAAQELDSEDGVRYFSKVFDLFAAFLYCGCSVLVTLSIPLAAILLRGEFFEGWRFVPLLMLSALIGCVSAFFGTFYNAAKQTGAVFSSTVAGAAVNVAIALALVNVAGVWGVLASSVIGQVVTLVYRVIDSRRFAPISYDAAGQLGSAAALLLQTIIISLLPGNVGTAVSAIPTIALLAYHGRRNGATVIAYARQLAGGRSSKERKL